MEGVALLKIFSRYRGILDLQVLLLCATGNKPHLVSLFVYCASEENEPWLASAVEVVGKTVEKIMDAGIAAKYLFSGFSQGLALRLSILHVMHGGMGYCCLYRRLIGDELILRSIKVTLSRHLFIEHRRSDAHVPVDRVMASAEIFKGMNASVTEKVYQGKSHSISINEVEHAKKVIFVK